MIVIFNSTKSGWYSDDPTVLSLNLLIRKISENAWSSQEETKVLETVEKVVTKIQESFIAECSVNQDIDEQDSTMIVFTTQVESVEESLVQFDNEKEKVELIQPEDVNNRVDVIMVGFYLYYIVHVKVRLILLPTLYYLDGRAIPRNISLREATNFPSKGVFALPYW